ncbi:MAG TPA: glycosyltransferase family 2 protein [Candidatus Acidoferrales bacterium]
MATSFIYDALNGINHTLFFYYLCTNLIYLFLLIVAIFSSTHHLRRLASTRLERLKASPLAPPISMLVPAHNEEKTIAVSVRSMLSLDYPEMEVVVVNDGSRDNTLAELVREFRLLRTDLLYVSEVPTAAVRGVYMSQIEPRLIVVDKEPGGSKADAVNAALNAASCPFICVVDADAILERDSLLRIMAPILTDPRRVVAAGGIVRVANGSRIVEGELRSVRLPSRPIEVLQVVEYLRAFLIGREGWAHFNMLMIISGAFGVFRRDLVRQAGGYRHDAIGEDFDMVARLHRLLLDRKEDYHISFVPDPVCWTQVPGDVKSLGSQRSRWQKGLMDVLWRNRGMLFNPRYGRVGLIALPYLWIFEMLAPVIEIVGYSSIILAALLGVLNGDFFLQFLIFGYAFATMISIGSVLQEEISYRRYNDWRDVVRLILYCFLEHFPYRQLQMIWRLKGMWQFLRGDTSWGKMERAGFETQAEAGVKKDPAAQSGLASR